MLTTANSLGGLFKFFGLPQEDQKKKSSHPSSCFHLADMDDCKEAGTSRDCRLNILRSDLRENVSCSICCDLFIANRPAYTCQEGHLVCGLCFVKVSMSQSQQKVKQRCPTCKTRWPFFRDRLSRARAVEKLAESQIIQCPLVSDNCSFIGPIRDVLLHLGDRNIHLDLSRLPCNFRAPVPNHPVPKPNLKVSTAATNISVPLQRPFLQQQASQHTGRRRNITPEYR